MFLLCRNVKAIRKKYGRFNAIHRVNIDDIEKEQAYSGDVLMSVGLRIRTARFDYDSHLGSLSIVGVKSEK